MLPRVTRTERKHLGQLAVDGTELERLARCQQALLIDTCDQGRAAQLACDAVEAVRDGLFWIVAARGRMFREMCCAVQKRNLGSVVWDFHPRFKEDAGTWARLGVKALLTTANDLRGHGKNPSLRGDICRLFCPFLMILDDDRDLLTMRKEWDPAFVLRQLVGTLSAHQDCVPLIIVVGCPSLAILPQRVKTAFGLEGLVYVDGSGGRANYHK
jgi:hypothetical protein